MALCNRLRESSRSIQSWFESAHLWVSISKSSACRQSGATDPAPTPRRMQPSPASGRFFPGPTAPPWPVTSIWLASWVARSTVWLISCKACVGSTSATQGRLHLHLEHRQRCATGGRCRVQTLLVVQQVAQGGAWWCWWPPAAGAIHAGHRTARYSTRAQLEPATATAPGGRPEPTGDRRPQTTPAQSPTPAPVGATRCSIRICRARVRRSSSVSGHQHHGHGAGALHGYGLQQHHHAHCIASVAVVIKVGQRGIRPLGRQLAPATSARSP